MKRLCVFLVLTIIFSCKTPVKDSYTIQANAPGVYNGMRVYLKVQDERSRLINVDTAIVIDEKFSFEGISNEPSLQYLTINSYTGNLPIIIENEDIKIQIEKDSLHTSKITGSKINDEFAEFSKKEKALSNEIRNILNSQRKTRQNNDNEENKRLTAIVSEKSKKLINLPLHYIDGHEDSFLSIINLHKMTLINRTSLDSIQLGFNKLSDRLKNSSYGAKISGYLELQKIKLEKEKATQIGAIAPNFISRTPEGENLALNGIKRKITIIDFWASWCGPCRRENPNVVKVYNKYHDKGLEIIGVSLDRNGQKDKWLKAIKDDKLTWHHVSNLQYFQDPIAKMYNINAIPTTFILDKTGKIIAKNLRGVALENKIAELLN